MPRFLLPLLLALAPLTPAGAAPFDWQTDTPENQGMSKPRLDALRDELARRKTRAFLVVRNDRRRWHRNQLAVFVLPEERSRRRDSPADALELIRHAGEDLVGCLGRPELDVSRAADQLVWLRDDLRADDRTHPSEAGIEKVSNLLLDFVHHDPLASSWYLRR